MRTAIDEFWTAVGGKARLVGRILFDRDLGAFVVEVGEDCLKAASYHDAVWRMRAEVRSVADKSIEGEKP